MEYSFHSYLLFFSFLFLLFLKKRGVWGERETVLLLECTQSALSCTLFINALDKEKNVFQ